MQKAEEAHYENTTTKWLDYLRHQETDFKTNQAETYAEFQEHRNEEREEIAEGQWQARREERLAEFDTEQN